MLDRLEKGSGQSVVTLQEAKSLLKEDDDLIIAVYDYWLEKRLKTVPALPVTLFCHLGNKHQLIVLLPLSATASYSHC